MKPVYEQIIPKTESLISVSRFSMPVFVGPYHFHPEIELTLIERSSGKRYVGGRVSDFDPGDLVLLGADVPHCWHGSEVSQGSENAQSIVIQFRKEFFGEIFWNLDEMADIRILLEKSQAGILIKGGTRNIVAQKMESTADATGFNRLMQLIDILHNIAISDETELIDDQFLNLSASRSETERFQRVFAYVIENYKQEISLNLVAEIACLTPTAFCRYFKMITNKTLTEVVTEYRLKHACQLLRTTAKPVSEVCIESGFGNISYFNKTFKMVKENTPLEYRKLFAK